MKAFFKKSSPVLVVGLFVAIALTMLFLLPRGGKVSVSSVKKLTRNLFDKDSLKNLDGDLGVNLANTGKLDGARRIFEELVASDPENASYLNNLGFIYAGLGDAKKGIESIEKAIEFDPKCGECFNNLASIYHRAGDAAKAVSYYDKAIQLQAAAVEPAINRAIALEQQSQFGNALEAYRQVNDKLVDAQMKKWVGLRILLLEDVVETENRKLLTER